MSTHGSAPAANEIMPLLLSGEDLSIPDVDLSAAEFNMPGDSTAEMYQLVTRLKTGDLTSRTVGGSGTFDALMDGFKAHLKEEYSAGRITGAEYTKAYIALTQSAMQNAVQFLLGRDSAFWQGVTAQAQAIAGRVAIATAKVQYAALAFDAREKRATYALTKLKLATEDAQYGNLTYQLDNMLPAQLAMVNEQTEGQRAQTLDTRTDGQPVAGVMGKQKDLYGQQITSYIRDAEVKAAKLTADLWTTHFAVVEPDEVTFDMVQPANIVGLIKAVQENNNLPYTPTPPKS